MDELRPNCSEIAFLNLAYQRLIPLFDEIMGEAFWEEDVWYRFSKVTNGFAIYGEVLNYEPIKRVIEQLKTARPPMEAEIGSELFKFIRNVIAHFPFFEEWNDVWINKSLVNWYNEGQSIDRFLNKYAGHDPIKYRFWESQKKRMTYLSINFPDKYEDESRIYLREIVSERDGVRFCFIMMRQIMNTQVDPTWNETGA
jgi:hypothetical protein